MLTAATTSPTPRALVQPNRSPKTVAPMATAVRGSSAPKIDVSVGPGTALASGVVWEPYTSQSKRVMVIDDQWSSNKMSQTDDLDFLRKTVYGK